MTLSYRRCPGVRVHGQSGVETPEGGRLILDGPLLELLADAEGRTLEQILGQPRPGLPTPLAVRAAVACLAEAQLLERRPDRRVEPPMPGKRGSTLVSAVIVAFHGIPWLEGLLPSLLRQTHDQIEIVVVDNGSSDDTADWVQREHPELCLVRLQPGRSLAAAINAGVDKANGDHLLILNQDVRLDSRAVEELLAVAEADVGCAAVAANLRLMRAPAFLNGLGNRVEASSWGTDNVMGHLDLGQFDEWREVPSACFAAMLLPRRAWAKVGRVDEGFPLYYEDVEWCYRARAHGLCVRVAPRALVFHAFGASGQDAGAATLPPAKLARVVHGRLRFALKLLAAHEAWYFVRNYLREDLQGLRQAARRLQCGEALAYLKAWGRVARDLPGLAARRRGLGAHRASPEGILAALPQHIPATRLQGQAPLLTSGDVMRDYGPLMYQGRTRAMPELAGQRPPVLLIVSQDVVDHRMAGPGLRYLEMARALLPDVDPVLAIPNETSLRVPGIHLVRYDESDPPSVQLLVDNADAAVVSGYMFTKFPFLLHTPTRLVVDLYDPLILENLHYYFEEPRDQQEQRNREAIHATNLGAQAGDFFICGSERQRDFWLGVLAANGRVNPLNHAADEYLSKLVDVVGLGLPSRSPRAGPGLKGRHPAIPAEARVVLWGGGVWNWLDPLTLIRAWPRVLDAHPEARLVFLGTRHPNPSVPRHVMAHRAQELARDLGEEGRSIVFIEWVDLDVREALLVEADVGVSLHPLHVETRYSVRARVMDYFWARLPVVVTDGDVASDWVARHGVGKVVPPGDAGAVSDALLETLGRSRGAWRDPYEELVESLVWSRLVDPLRRYCLSGSPPAPDRPLRGQVAAAHPTTPAPGAVVRAIDIWRHQGLLALARRTAGRAGRQFRGR